MTAAGTTARARSWRPKFGPIWLAAPALAFVAVFLLWPMARLMGLSIQDADTQPLSKTG